MANVSVSSRNQYLTFFLAGEEYAIGIMQVTDIIEWSAVTKVPGMPAWIRGVHNLRGVVVPVIDLALKFGVAATAVTHRTCIVIVEVNIDGEAVTLGVMTDSVHQVIDLEASEIQPPPAFGSNVSASCLAGMGLVHDKFLLILDIDHVLSAGELLTAMAVTSDDRTEIVSHGPAPTTAALNAAAEG